METIPFTHNDWARIRRDYAAWWQWKLDRPLVYFTNVAEPESRSYAPEFCNVLANYPREVSEAEIANMFVASRAHLKYPGDTFPCFFVNFGPGILAALFGAELTSNSETVWFKPAAGANLSNLRIKLDLDSYWWRRIKMVTETAVEMFGDVWQVSFTDLGGNLDILASLIGTEELLIALKQHPDIVNKAGKRITHAWLTCYDQLCSIIRKRCPGTQSWAVLWAPGMILPKIWTRH